ncbi:MAG: hypothetical protein IJO20_06120 [Ruminococcus sp.]|nr:hypothetical protein [Ruminococcus sp.]MBQ7134054.1 hypothetical protein [Ruminococcus sp.]
MFLAIITAAVCFLAAVIMFSSYFRKMTLLRPLAIYLIFEGCATMLTYILSDLNPVSTLGDTIQQIGTIAIVVYYIFILLMTKSKSKKKKKGEK